MIMQSIKEMIVWNSSHFWERIKKDDNFLLFICITPISFLFSWNGNQFQTNMLYSCLCLGTYLYRFFHWKGTSKTWKDSEILLNNWVGERHIICFLTPGCFKLWKQGKQTVRKLILRHILCYPLIINFLKARLPKQRWGWTTLLETT